MQVTLIKIITMIIIGITGTIGAGKGTIVEYLITHYNFTHFSVRQYLIDEALKRNMPLNRDTYVTIANDLRSSHSPSFIIDELYKQAKELKVNAIIESIRTPGEIESLRKTDHFILFAIDAQPQTRYQRISERKSETDAISFETFMQNEQREMTSNDPNKQNLSYCIQQADYKFLNEGSREDLYINIDKVMQKILQF